MKEQDLEGKELEYRARLFSPWLEEEATKEFFDIINKKSIALTRQLKGVSLTQPNRNEFMANIQGKIETCEMFYHLPHGVLKRYDRAKKAETQKQEVKNGE